MFVTEYGVACLASFLPLFMLVNCQIGLVEICNSCRSSSNLTEICSTAYDLRIIWSSNRNDIDDESFESFISGDDLDLLIVQFTNRLLKE